MSETPAVAELQNKRAQRIAEENQRLDQLDKNLPHPVGYKILIALPHIEETFAEEGAIIKADQTRNREQVLSMIGVVLEMGDGAYIDPKRFPSGPWCEVGDYIMFRANSGTRFLIGGHEYRLMNDDSVEAVVPNPRAISRVN